MRVIRSVFNWCLEEVLFKGRMKFFGNLGGFGLILCFIATIMRLTVDCKLGFDGVPFGANLWYCGSVLGVALLTLVIGAIYQENFDNAPDGWFYACGVLLGSVIAAAAFIYFRYGAYYFHGSTVLMNACLLIGTGSL